MPHKTRNLTSRISAIAAALALLVGVYVITQKNLATAPAAASNNGSFRAAHGQSPARHHPGCSVAMGTQGAALHGKPVVIRGTLINGKKFSTAGWKGHVVVVDFWATWCPWCRAQMPDLEKMYGKYHSRGLEMVGVSLSSTAVAVRNYLKTNPKAVWPQIFDQGAGNAALAQKLGVSAFPAQCVIDRGSILRYTVVGRSSQQLGADGRKLTADVRKLLRKGKAAP